MSTKIYVQYGCGTCAPINWHNYDASPTLRLQQLPLFGDFLKRKMSVIFPNNVRYGDIISGLPYNKNTIDGIYCSHTLEHLSLFDLRIAIKNTYELLKTGGVFRCVLPDLEFCARKYLVNLENGILDSSLSFMGSDTLLGHIHREKGFIAFIKSFYGNSNHLWMWDFYSLSNELKNAGFTKIRRAYFNDSKDEMFLDVEDVGRFDNALAIECFK